MKKYKFKLIRTSVIKGAARELENIANAYSEKGWEFKSAQYLMIFYAFCSFLRKMNKEGHETCLRNRIT